jgi:hypothetical protein
MIKLLENDFEQSAKIFSSSKNTLRHKEEKVNKLLDKWMETSTEVMLKKILTDKAHSLDILQAVVEIFSFYSFSFPINCSVQKLYNFHLQKSFNNRWCIPYP